MTSLTFSNGVTSLGRFMFEGCPNLTNIVLGNTITSIDYCTFLGCSSLSSVTVSGSVTHLGGAFYYCTSLTNFTIPANVTSIGYGMFSGCTNLASVYIEGNAPAIVANEYEAPDYVFGYDNNAKVYYLPGTTGWSNTFAGVPAVLWNPQIQTADGNFGLRGNHFGFNITGTTSIPIAVQACSNLANPVWTSLTNGTLTNGSFHFSDPVPANNSPRFYRICAP